MLRLLVRVQSFSQLIVTCSTFALYTSAFTKNASQALATADNPDNDFTVIKRWETLGKFETNFNFWLVSDLYDMMHKLKEFH